jgi:hypothetical protein
VLVLTLVATEVNCVCRHKVCCVPTALSCTATIELFSIALVLANRFVGLPVVFTANRQKHWKIDREDSYAAASLLVLVACPQA